MSRWSQWVDHGKCARATLVLLVFLAAGFVPAAQSAQVADTTAESDAPGALWAHRAIWSGTGMATQHPDHIAFPFHTYLALDLLDAHDALDRVDVGAAAGAVQRMQDPGSGFRGFAGDVLGPSTEETMGAVLVAQSLDATIDTAGAIAFLRSMQNPDGGFAPRAGFFGGGNLGSTMQATHEAVVGLTVLGGMTADIAAAATQFLLLNQAQDGGWPRSPGVGAPSTLHGTYHAVGALDALGALDPASGTRAAVFLLAHQDPGGGFFDVHAGWCPLPVCPPETETTTVGTGQAVLTLTRLGVDVLLLPTLPAHALWLAARQTDEGPGAGGFDSQAEQVPVVRYPVSTWFAMKALDAMGVLELVDVEAALGYFVAAQHQNTGGFGWWEGFAQDLASTEAAVLALEHLGRLDLAEPVALEAALDAHQRADGALVEPWWDWDPRLDHHAYGLLARARLGAQGGIDEAAALDWLIARQHPDGGFTSTEFPGVTIEATYLGVSVLASYGRLGDVDADGAAAYLASQQRSGGGISSVGVHDPVHHVQTMQALVALELLDRLHAVNVEAATDWLAAQQRPAGSFERVVVAHATAKGLDVAGALHKLDAEAAAQYIAGEQRPDGGYADKEFQPFGSMRIHAAAVEALAILGP